MNNKKKANKQSKAQKSFNLPDTLSLQLIKNDFETIQAIIYKNHENEGAPIISLVLLPYFSLSCVEALNFLKDKRIISNIKNNSSHSPEIIRNDLKKMMNRINKIYKGVLEIDEEVDLRARNEVKYDFIKMNNLYYNIGFYSNENHQLISNTQYMKSMFKNQKENIENKDSSETPSAEYLLGEYLGKYTKSITTLLGTVKLTEFNKPFESDIRVFYKDMHTDNLELLDGLDKAQTLFIIHTLSSLNGIKNLLSTILPWENTYLFRIKYIVTYYAYCGLAKFTKNMTTQNKNITPEIEVLINIINAVESNKKAYFNMNFRSCMMHYGLKNDGIFSIDRNLLNQQIPFYGLIESCFNVKKFEEQNTIITSLMNELSITLEKVISLNLDSSNLLD